MERFEKWRMLLERLDCIEGDQIRPPQGHRLHLYFGNIDMSPRADRPVRFDDNTVYANDIHFTGDTAYCLWDDLTSVSVK